MQSYHRVHVQLGRKDRWQLAAMLTKGRESARVLRRASILRQLDRGQKAAQVAANVGVAAKTVRAVARRYEEEGLESALYEKARPGKQRALDVGQSQRIIAMVCGSPPQGIARWSVRLIPWSVWMRSLWCCTPMSARRDPCGRDGLPGAIRSTSGAARPTSSAVSSPRPGGTLPNRPRTAPRRSSPITWWRS